MVKKLYIFMAHIDDFECSCYGYLFKHYKEYEKIYLVIATMWENKRKIILNNLNELPDEIKNKIEYINLDFEARTLTDKFDSVKDKFYKMINWNEKFDMLTHDENDTHTDHRVLRDIGMGLYKYVDRYVTVYSPSSINFSPNYFIGLTKQNFKYKKDALDKYDIQKEQSYSKLGYYLQSDEHYNIGRAYVLENFVNKDYEYYETYKILKWI